MTEELLLTILGYIYLISTIACIIISKYSKNAAIFWFGFIPAANTVISTFIISDKIGICKILSIITNKISNWVYLGGFRYV